MSQKINVERCAIWLYNKYGFIDPIIELQDIYSIVQTLVLVHGYTELEFIRRRTIDALEHEFSKHYNKLYVEQEILREQSVNYEDYIIRKIDGMNGIDWEDSIYRLGVPCKRKHELMDTKRTLRYKSNNGCYACINEPNFTKYNFNSYPLLDYIRVNVDM